MGRLLGYMATHADRLRDALHQEREVIAPAPSRHPVGWGIGFYQGGEVLHKKRPLLEGEKLDWEQVANNVRSDCVVIHLRQPTVGDFRLANMHPFRMRSWLFAHNGTVQRFQAIQPRLLEQMPDFLRRNIRGETDSEHVFHVILSFLHDAGHLDNPEVDERVVLNAMRSAVAMVDRLSAEVGATPSTLNMVLTNGRRMFAMRRGAPLMYVERQGFHDPSIEERSEPSSSAAAVRYVLIVSDNATIPRDYKEIPDSSFVVVDRDLVVSTHKL